MACAAEDHWQASVIKDQATIRRVRIGGYENTNNKNEQIYLKICQVRNRGLTEL